ncbi:MAG TPA: flagellar protein FliT [Anaerovoracaceae bacterium]|nr:flagellar protein FliT [Anaerovoracaceae bacterium]
MSTLTLMEYYHKKKALLKQCLDLSEKLPPSIENWESVPGLLSDREAVLLQLKELEETAEAGAKSLLSQEMKQELDQMIKQIQDLDQESARLIRREQESILDSLKANAQGRKLTQYAQATDLAQGRKLDYRK